MTIIVLNTTLVVLMLLCMVMCTLLLLAITRYSAHSLEQDLRAMALEKLDYESPFYSWWLKKCEADWLRAYFFFRLGVSVFLIDIGLLSWVQFDQSIATSLGITIIATMGFLYWQLHMTSKWGFVMRFPQPPSNYDPNVPPPITADINEAANSAYQKHTPPPQPFASTS